MSAELDMNWWSAKPRWVTHACRGNPLASVVYDVLAQSANVETGQCSIGRALIARQAGCSTDSVDRAVRFLVGIGAVTVERQQVRGARLPDPARRNVYTVHTIQAGGSRMGAAQKNTKGKQTKRNETTATAADAAAARCWHVAASHALDGVARDRTTHDTPFSDERAALDAQFWPLVEHLRAHYPNSGDLTEMTEAAYRHITNQEDNQP